MKNKKYYYFDDEKLTFIKTNISLRNKIFLGYSILLTVFILYAFKLKTNYKDIDNISYEEAVLVIEKHKEKITEEKLYETLVELNIKHPHIVLAQALIESSSFKSDIFIENNNMFGMREAKSRATTALGTNRGHAYYNNWRECAIDYALYQNAYLKGLNEESYLKYLQTNYAEAENYYTTIKNLSQKLKEKYK